MIALGLTGFPLGHSLSPLLHQAAMAYCHFKGSYSLFPVEPGDLQGLKSLLERVRTGELNGLNVTIPHKQAIQPLLDRLTPAAVAIGAVNTIFVRDGQLTGDNTDAPGFLIDLERLLPDDVMNRQGKKKVLVLGAGGAARAVVWALANEGWQVSLAARRKVQAQALIAQFPSHASLLTYVDYSAKAIEAVVEDLSLIVNTTPLGMSPNIENSPWPAGVGFPQKAACYDLVYNPRETAFVRAARTAGLKASSGLGMLVEQAGLAFEIWTGQRVPAANMLAAVEAV